MVRRPGEGRDPEASWIPACAGMTNREFCGFINSQALHSAKHPDHHQENAMGRMFNPPHPGETLKEDVLPALGLTVTEAAQQLGVTRTALSRVLNGHAAISLEMARRIEAWLGPDRGGRAELWLGLQMDYDLWVAEQRPAPKVTRAPELLAA
jgi:addiction module HigA family antidote